MAGNDHTKKYGTVDIERYVNGLMTPAEMYAMEKEMQDDPFLAEAVEGFMTVPAAFIQKPMMELAARLEQLPAGAGEVIPIRRRRNWLAVAAAVLVILSVGASWYWLNTSTEQNIARHDQQENTTQPKVATNPETDPIPGPATADTQLEEQAAPAEQKAVQVEKTEPVQPKKEAPQTPVSAEIPAPVEQESRDAATIDKADSHQGQERLVRVPATARQAPQQHIATYILGGTVTDSTNKPLPFVNIAVDNTNINTYSDANGYFSIIAGDSTLTAHIKSVGFEDQTVLLSASVRVNKVQLKAANTEEIVATGYGTRKRTQNAKKQRAEVTEEDSLADREEDPWAEPRDGWGYYDIYLQNNQRIAGFRGSTVDLSFMITPLGHMYDFKIEQSNCPACSREAIRLIKEGPAWKLHGSKVPFRVSVSLQF